MQDVEGAAEFIQQATADGTGASDDDDMDFEVHKRTVEEVKMGWAQGPLTPARPDWLGATRFGMRQGQLSSNR